MPVVEQSNMRLEFPAGNEQSIRSNGTIMLRARVSPPHVNNRVWFAYQVDEGQWLHRQANRESASGDEEQYSLAVDVSAVQAGLLYLAYVRRNGVTVPKGADSGSPNEDPSLTELTVHMSLADHNIPSREVSSGNESSEGPDTRMETNMPYELFDPTKPCTSLLPLNAVQNKLNFYKVSIFEISLEDIANIADLPEAYARSRRSKDKIYLGLPISTLFPDLQVKYQEVRLGNDKGKEIPVVMGLEGSFLPFDPNRPVPLPLPEHSVSIADLDKGQIKVGTTTIALDDKDQFRLATQGVAFVKVNGGTVRLNLNQDGDSNGR